MRFGHGVITVSFHLMLFSLSVSTLESEMEPWLPSETEFFNCPQYIDCTGDLCHFHRTSNETTSKRFLTNDDSIIRCNPLKVDIFYPSTNDSTFSGMEHFTCFRYANDNGTSFSVLEMSLNKPEDVNGTQLTCTVDPVSSNCTQQTETSTEFVFVAGLPSTCAPWIPTYPVTGTDPTQEPAFYCPGYANCSGTDCLYNRIVPITDRNPFNNSETAALRCDSLHVKFNFPDRKDESFVGNETWTCFRYYDGVGHHFAILKMTLNKPSDVNGIQVKCTASIGHCALFNETSSEITFIAGLPDSCVPWIEYATDETDPSLESAFYCPGYANCTGGDCRYNRMYAISDWKSFNRSEEAASRCDSLAVEFNFPDSKGESFVGNNTWTCYRFYDEIGHHFAIEKITLNKPIDVNASQVNCSANIGNCTLLKENSYELNYVAGLPNNCVPWIEIRIEETDPSQLQAFYCPGYANCSGDDCLYNRMSPVSDWKSFNKSEKAAMRCDSLEVEFNFPDSNDQSFVGNETWTCFRYYDGVGHHFAILKITLNKPIDVNGSQVICTASIGNCTLLTETSFDLSYVAGLPNNCVPWSETPENGTETPANGTETPANGTEAPGNVTGIPTKASSGQMKLDWATIVFMTASFLLSSLITSKKIL